MAFFVIRVFIVGNAKGITAHWDLQSSLCVLSKVKHLSDEPQLIYCANARAIPSSGYP
jgi:hypothetical protein